ncbi:MAG: hypothetical protein FWC10_07410, partial [Lentimicrobiaceae bacterium]|nr:hypothetical protein [Lentimicrobiaceae bacterium]
HWFTFLSFFCKPILGRDNELRLFLAMPTHYPTSGWHSIKESITRLKKITTFALLKKYSNELRNIFRKHKNG